MNRQLFVIFFLSLSFSFYEAIGSHIVGGEVTYKFIKDTSIVDITYHEYEVSVTIYEDCLNGNPQAIAADNPAYLCLYDPLTGEGFDTSEVYFASEITVPANFSNACVSDIPPICTIKKTFIKNYYLQPNTDGYMVSYQRCCRNAAIVNIEAPNNTGSTYYCIIPSSRIAEINNSAVFNNYPPQIICLNNPLYYDNSATDADRDSLSYGFCSALISLNTPTGGNNIAPAAPPPYDSVRYINPPWSAQYPVSSYPALQIDPVTGLITGTPNALGRFLVTVCCNEYRNGVLVNTIKREFQFVVTPCTKTVVADIPQYSTDFNTYIVDCSGYTVNFVNTSTGGFSYHWDFGVPGSTNDTSSDFEPTFTYPDTGVYSVKLIVNPNTSCPDSITRYVKIYPYFHANFSDSGNLCPGVPISFLDQSSATIKPVNYWKWNFGDGDTSFVENPVHSYNYGGIYNVTLVSANIRNCTDTVLKQVLVDDFTPFAGNDTTIVKGQTVLFNATGGVNYYWSPGTGLNDTAIYDPIGYYPDTGAFTYYVYVTSELGCSGYDTLKVTVVNHTEFFVPTAFTPNGDGKNDVFRPIAVGYKALNYFRVYNRWGQIVYNNSALDAGWDGTYNNEKADIGTYFWELGYIDIYGNEGSLKGDVTLIR